MKRNGLWKKICATALCLALPFQATGCILTSETSAPVGILSIEKTATDGLQDIYTVYFSDGSTTCFTVTNGANGTNGKDGEDGANGKDGKDGENGKDISAAELYETYKTIYGEQLTYDEFLQKYLVVEEAVPKDNSEAVNACLRSVGRVYCTFTEYNTATFDRTDTQQALYTGACVIYRMDTEYTYFLTNYHVVYDESAVSEKLSTTAYCYLYGSEDAPVKMKNAAGETYLDYGDYGIECTYIGGSIEHDLALLQAKTSDVKAINETATAVTLAEEYHVGETAIAIGNPGGDGISVTQGVVCVDGEYITLSIDGSSRSYRSIRIDTPLYSGNSGGGVFNAAGKLIGVANAGDTEDQNVNYAIPLPIVKNVTENVLRHYADGDDSTLGVYKPTLGVTVKSINSRYVYDAETGYGKIAEDVVIEEVTADSIAEKIGLQSLDVLTALEIDGVLYPIDRQFQIADGLLLLTDGVSFRLGYVRDGAEEFTSPYEISRSDLKSVA